MKPNPLIDAVNMYDVIVDSQANLMHAIGGCAVLENWDEALSTELWDLTLDTWAATRTLTPRGRAARMNLIWAEFVAKHRDVPMTALPPQPQVTQ